MPCVGAYYSFNHGTHTAHFRVKIRTHTRHIFEIFGNGQNRRRLFVPDLRLFKPNAEQDEGISSNSQTQHRRTANMSLAVTLSNSIFLRLNAESSQRCIILALDLGREDWWKMHYVALL